MESAEPLGMELVYVVALEPVGAGAYELVPMEHSNSGDPRSVGKSDPASERVGLAQANRVRRRPVQMTQNQGNRSRRRWAGSFCVSHWRVPMMTQRHRTYPGESVCGETIERANHGLPSRSL
jgi:hypothetical protein